MHSLQTVADTHTHILTHSMKSVFIYAQSFSIYSDGIYLVLPESTSQPCCLLSSHRDAQWMLDLIHWIHVLRPGSTIKLVKMTRTTNMSISIYPSSLHAVTKILYPKAFPINKQRSVSLV